MKNLLKISFIFVSLLKLLNGQTGVLTGRQDSAINLISLAGFSNELHRVVTDDGYILRVHRIFPKTERFRRGPVLLMHGFLGTAADYLLSGPSLALAFQLASNGYQVFLGNVRGSRFSMKHQTLDPLSREFWRFTFDEIAMHDLPAMIDYILLLTRQQGVFYVGHNQGATALLALLSTRPDFNAKILQAHFLAPIAFMDHPHPILSFGALEYEESVKVLRNFNFLSMADYTKKVVDTYCQGNRISGPRFCLRLWEFIFGRNRGETEIDPQVLLQVPTFISPTASVRQYLHFLQIYGSGKFQSYRSHRLQKEPREYLLRNVNTPLYLYHAAEDMVVSRLDIERLRNTLMSIVKLYKIIPNWNHYDLLLSRNAKTLLYDDMVKAMTNDGLDFVGFVRTVISG